MSACNVRAISDPNGNITLVAVEEAVVVVAVGQLVLEPLPSHVAQVPILRPQFLPQLFRRLLPKL
jgi:hypothetical protein